MRIPAPRTTTVFFLTGLVSGTWAARIPAVRERLDLSAGELGIAVLGIEAGAVAGLAAAGVIVARVGSRRTVRAAFCAFAPLVVLPALVPSLAWLVAGLVAWAAANSVVDVAMNVQGVDLERRLRRPVLSGLHAGQAFGLLAGGGVSTAVVAAGVGLAAHTAAVALVALAAALGATRGLPDVGRRDGPAFLRPPRPLVALGTVAFCLFLVDGVALNWAAVHLEHERGAAPAVAAAGFTAFAASVAVVRLVGDRLVQRLGRARLVRGGALLIAAGGGVAIAVPSVVPALAGWALVGAGLAALVPAVLGAAAGVAHGMPPAAAIAAVTTVGYLGSFTGPPLIGALAEVAGLSAALGLLVAAALIAAALARRALAGAG